MRRKSSSRLFLYQSRQWLPDRLVVPRDVADPTFLVKYLRDSCHMDIASQGALPDIELVVHVQVSGYEHEMTEKHVLKSEMTVSATEKTSPRHAAVQRRRVYEKSYRMGIEVPTGLFFWETARELGHEVKTALMSL